MGSRRDEEEDARLRKHPRTELSLLVQYRFDTFEDFLAEYSVNISPGGIFIKTSKPHETGAIIYLQFSLRDGSRLIEGMGRVVHVTPPGPGVREPGIGVEFLNFDEASQDLVADICASRLPGKH
jgi:molecular chaperone DnaK